tara:strand:- start:1772 stop:2842 length:1071 start_codon:yes stop_codon:yes gene_type:complete
MNIQLINDDCLDALKDLSDNSIDLLFCDLPYGETSCKWDTTIDLNLFWKQINRICKITTPMFFTCSTRFGTTLINSNPKNFRYDLVWVKSQACGFLNAKKMPMRKHEMVYVFYRKLPYYDLSSHKHKILKERKTIDYKNDSFIYGKIDRPDHMRKNGESSYEPPLPNSVIKTELYSSENKEEPRELYRNEGGQYEPPLPNTILKEGQTEGDKGNEVYCKFNYYNNGVMGYDPPLPDSIIKTEELCKYDVNKNTYGGGKEGRIKISKNKEDHEIKYEPPLPNSLLEIKSEKGKHPTQKPCELIKWCLKYYSKEGDTILDPTMGSGSTGVACKSMNRNFIGIEKDLKIFKIAEERINN